MTSMVVYSPANDTTILGLSMTLCITMCMWMICTVLRTQYEIDTLKERFARIHDMHQELETLDFEVKTDSHQEQIHDLHQRLDTFEKESREKFAVLERQCDLYRKYTYHVIDLKDKNNTMTKQLEALQSWVDLYRKTRGI